ncbi:TAXI family TRAP transporter solute-binding subunit [Acidobacteriota bacterium]
MMRKKRIAGTAAFIIAIIFFLPNCNNLDFVSIGTGAVTGIYYPTGGAISRMINKKMAVYHIKATVEATAGSVYNVNAVLSGDLEFGVVQSDRQYQAWHGLSEWEEKGPRKNLRAVFSIHPESVTLIASVECGAIHVTDLKGLRVNIGNPGSGPLGNARDALSAFGLSEKDITSEYVKAVEAPGLLQDERIDAFFYTVGHPNGNIKEATSGRVKVRFIPLHGPPVDALIEKHSYYTKAVIPQKFYPNAKNTADIQSFGVCGTLVTSVKVDERIVYAITKEIFENFEEFISLHPAYAGLTKKGMLSGLSAPLHKGALKYYREANLYSPPGEDIQQAK